MAELKTKRNAASAAAFLNSIADAKKRQDAKALLAMMKRITGKKPEMWGTSVVGFGRYHYKYASGREGDWFLTGFSPRAQNLTVYCMSGFRPLSAQLRKLGKHKVGVGCLYFKTLDDLHVPTLEALIRESVASVLKRSQS